MAGRSASGACGAGCAKRACRGAASAPGNARPIPTTPCPCTRDLARELTLSAPDQLWAADITYVRLLREFIYAAVILDVFSRRAVGWAVGPSLRTELPLAALEQALKERRPAAGLVHHSDRGSQYASKLYVQRLEDHEIVISMSRQGNPYDNRLRREFHQDAQGRRSLLQRI